MNVVYRKSLREQRLERENRGLMNLYEDEMKKNSQWEELYEQLKENFHQLAMMKVTELARVMARTKEANREAKKKPH